MPHIYITRQSDYHQTPQTRALPRLKEELEQLSHDLNIFDWGDNYLTHHSFLSLPSTSSLVKRKQTTSVLGLLHQPPQLANEHSSTRTTIILTITPPLLMMESRQGQAVVVVGLRERLIPWLQDSWHVGQMFQPKVIFDILCPSFELSSCFLLTFICPSIQTSNGNPSIEIWLTSRFVFSSRFGFCWEEEEEVTRFLYERPRGKYIGLIGGDLSGLTWILSTKTSIWLSYDYWPMAWPKCLVESEACWCAWVWHGCMGIYWWVKFWLKVWLKYVYNTSTTFNLPQIPLCSRQAMEAKDPTTANLVWSFLPWISVAVATTHAQSGQPNFRWIQSLMIHSWLIME